MDFSILTNDNVILYATKHYDNPACHGINEITEDFDRIKYVKRLFKRYQIKGVLKERLILNHIIIVYNVFGPSAATRLLFFRLEPELWPILKTFLIFLNFMPERVCGVDVADIVSAEVSLDQNLIDKLRCL